DQQVALPEPDQVQALLLPVIHVPGLRSVVVVAHDGEGHRFPLLFLSLMSLLAAERARGGEKLTGGEEPKAFGVQPTRSHGNPQWFLPRANGAIRWRNGPAPPDWSPRIR